MTSGFKLTEKIDQETSCKESASDAEYRTLTCT